MMGEALRLTVTLHLNSDEIAKRAALFQDHMVRGLPIEIPGRGWWIVQAIRGGTKVDEITLSPHDPSDYDWPID